MSSVGALDVADLQCLECHSVGVDWELWVWIPVVWLSPLLLSGADECATIRPPEEIAVVELWWGEGWKVGRFGLAAHFPC